MCPGDSNIAAADFQQQQPSQLAMQSSQQQLAYII
jgi:hypothetical protein